LLTAYARVVVRLRWFVVLFWAVAATAAVIYLPTVGQGGSDLSELVSENNRAVQSEIRSFDAFGFPLLSRVAVVQRDPKGLPPKVQTDAVARARAVTRGDYPDVKPILAAVPVTNVEGVIPGSKESGTTIITWLFTAPDATLADATAAADRLVKQHYTPNDAVIGVTGSVPARVAQGRLVLDSLPWLETATVMAVFIIVAFAFRSLIAPMIALAVAGVAVLLTLHIGGEVALRLGVPVPQETQPLLVALLLGVVTDYAVFYLAAVRTQLADGADRLTAAERATARFTSIIVTAGMTAAAGTGALVVAGSPAFRAFGPGMALAVLIGMLVAVTLVPALLAILGPAALWSRRQRVSGLAISIREDSNGRGARLLTRRWFAPVMVALSVGALLFAALPMRHLTLGVSFVEALPASNPARHAADQAEAGFADGILSPTELLLEGAGVSAKQDQLKALQRVLATQPGVAAVIGPGDDAVPQELNLFRAPNNNAARYLVVLTDEPLGARAVHTVDGLTERLPGLMKQAGLTDVRASFGGDTAIAKVVVDQTVNDLGRIALAALIANLLFLAMYLRALAAPIALLFCSVLAIGATLGLTTWLFQDVLGGDGLTFYVPFAAAVLLVALGSDYNIFGVGPAWKEARGRPLHDALAITLPHTARAIRTAAVTLAVSFGLLVIVPLRPFQELAFALSVGVLIDAFVVRSLLAPALLSVMGPSAGWPGRRPPAEDEPAPQPDPQPAEAVG
jgi:RND superfamily putative drug exporter